MKTAQFVAFEGMSSLLRIDIFKYLINSLNICLTVFLPCVLLILVISGLISTLQGPELLPGAYT